jgi:DNA-binding transcriptional LysR family regulator
VVVDLRQLRYLVAVADEGGIRKASRQLHLAQPSLSQALRQLESELGVELIHRSTRGTELTEAGVEFLSHAREILDRAATAQAAMRRRAEQRSCTLRVGLLAGIIAAGELTAPILKRFHQSRPDVDVRLQDIGFGDQGAPLLNGEVDVALIRTPLVDRQIDVVPLALDPRVLLVGATHELADADHVDIEDILDERTVPVVAPHDFTAFWHIDHDRGLGDGSRAPERPRAGRGGLAALAEPHCGGPGAHGPSTRGPGLRRRGPGHRHEPARPAARRDAARMTRVAPRR